VTAEGPGPRAIVIAAGAHIFGAAHVPAIVETGIVIVGVFDTDMTRAAAVAAPQGWPVMGSLDELLGTPADLAIICAPHPLHAALVGRCLDAGMDVLVEKPVAARLSEIDEVVERAASRGRFVAVVHQHRFRTEVREAARMLARRDIGRVHRAVLTASYPKRANYYTDTPWRGTWRGEGGGVLLNQGLHDVDLLVHLLGRPSRVMATMRTLVHPIETEDTVDALIEWSDGAVAVLHVTSAAALDGNRIEVFGSSGALRLSARGLETRSTDEDFDVFARTAGGHFDVLGATDWHLRVPAGGGTHSDVYADVIAAWRARTHPRTSATAARDAVEVIAAATLSSDLGRAWHLPVRPGEYDGFLADRLATTDTRAPMPARAGRNTE
jgi:predicted dehydrogenase